MGVKLIPKRLKCSNNLLWFYILRSFESYIIIFFERVISAKRLRVSLFLTSENIGIDNEKESRLLSAKDTLELVWDPRTIALHALDVFLHEKLWKIILL